MEKYQQVVAEKNDVTTVVEKEGREEKRDRDEIKVSREQRAGNREQQ